jgi:hypothetical protein
MKAVNVHGGGAVFARTSCRLGLPPKECCIGMATLRGLEGMYSSADMVASSSASQFEATGDIGGEVSGVIFQIGCDEFLCDFRIIIAFLRRLLRKPPFFFFALVAFSSRG